MSRPRAFAGLRLRTRPERHPGTGARSASRLALILALLLALPFAAVADEPGRARVPRILFDEAHGQRAGNADWTIGGAYSGWADLLRRQGMEVTAHERGDLDGTALAGMDVLVLPEPNRAYSELSIAAIERHVREGGGLVLVADHHGSDRDRDGKDSVAIFNAFAPRFGMRFAEAWITEAPVVGPRTESPLTYRVRRLGIWAGTGITVTGDASADFLFSARNGGKAALAHGIFGKGRVVAIGDSSPFDDGRGDPAKKLHDAWSSFLYDGPQLASNMVRWAAGLETVVVNPPVPVNPLSVRRPDRHEIVVVLDAAHENLDVDQTRYFREALEEATLHEEGDAGRRFAVYYNMEAFRAEALTGVDVLVIPSPRKPFSAEELSVLYRYVRGGGSLHLASCSDYVQKNDAPATEYLNVLLERLGSKIRFNDDQLQNDRLNFGRPWSLIADRFAVDPLTTGVRRMLFWSACSLSSTAGWDEADGPHALVLAAEGTRSVDGDGEKDATPLADGAAVLMAREDLGYGRLVAAGAFHLGDHQFTTRMNAEGRFVGNVGEHQSASFATRLMSWMARVGEKKVETGAVGKGIDAFVGLFPGTRIFTLFCLVYLPFVLVSRSRLKRRLAARQKVYDLDLASYLFPLIPAAVIFHPEIWISLFSLSFGSAVTVSLLLGFVMACLSYHLHYGQKVALRYLDLDAFLYLFPALVIISVFHLYPVIYSFALSVCEGSIQNQFRDFVGLSHYREIWNDPGFWLSMRNTVFFVVGTVPLTIAFSLSIALLLNSKIKGLSFYRTVYFLPVITSVAAVSLVWKWVYHPEWGILNHFLRWVGFEGRDWLRDSTGLFQVFANMVDLQLPDWMAGPSIAMCCIIAMSVWKGLGYNVIIFLAGLQNIPKELYEAARIDGAGVWDSFWKITWPLLSPTTYFIMIMSTISSFQVFAQIFMLYSGNATDSSRVIVYYLYEKGFQMFQIGYASAVAYVLFFMVFCLTIVQRKFVGKKVHYG